MIRSVTLLVVAQVLALGLWFSTTAVVASLAAAHGLAIADLALLATGTQVGFVLGALAFALTNLPDRMDPRRLFAICAAVAAAANLSLLALAPDGALATGSRLLVGAALAGVYPVGLKIAVGWSIARRALLAGLLVGAVTLGSATPHLVALLGGADPETVLWVTSGLALVSSVLVLGARLGPHHAPARPFRASALFVALRSPALRSAYFGYFGHMWELYAYWAWLPAAMLAAGATQRFASGVMLLSMVIGGLACVPMGHWADGLGKGRVARALLMASCGGALASGLLAESPLVLLVPAVLFWGATIVPDSPLFSAMVADAAPAHSVGSLLTLQVAIGFSISAVSVHLSPIVAERLGWGVVFGVLAVGPALGAAALRVKRRQPGEGAAA